MKKIFDIRISFTIAAIIMAVFVLVSPVGAAGLIPGTKIPGIDCGNSEATDSAKSCCTTIETEPDLGTSLIERIPAVGGFIRDINSFITDAKRSVNVVPCVMGLPSDVASPNCTCLKQSEITPAPLPEIKKICSTYLTGIVTREGTIEHPELADCEDCAERGGVWTAVRCVEGDYVNFIQKTLLGMGISLAGGVALLCIIFAAFQMQTSKGNAEKIKKAQELMTSCIMGLMLIIFSVFILRLIGVDILKIPGLK